MSQISNHRKVRQYARDHPKISEMLPGEVCWTVPWQFYVSKSNTLYVIDMEEDIRAEDRPHGTATVRIEKTKDGYKVDATEGFDCLDCSATDAQLVRNGRVKLCKLKTPKTKVEITVEDSEQNEFILASHDLSFAKEAISDNDLDEAAKWIDSVTRSVNSLLRRAQNEL